MSAFLWAGLMFPSLYSRRHLEELLPTNLPPPSKMKAQREVSLHPEYSLLGSQGQ